MEELVLYETNWSLFGVDGQLLPGPPSSPFSNEWHQQDDLKKVLGVPAGTPSMVEELIEIEEQLSPNDLKESWLDSKIDLVNLLLEKDQLSPSDPDLSHEISPQVPLQSHVSTFLPDAEEGEAIDNLLQSLERDVPDEIVDLENGHNGSKALFEILTSDDTQCSSNTVTLSVEDIDSILSSSPSSPVGSTSDSFDSDPNWSPSNVNTNKQRCSDTRPAPYEKQGRSVYSNADKKLRKKEQNRTAATRYRIKKREEHGTLSDEYLRLETRNKELKETIGNISREISYLKNLMADVYKAKNILKNK